MTPAVNLAKKLKLDYQVHEYHHDANAESYGLEAADKLGLPPEQVFKTLVVATESDKLAVAVLPVSHTLNFKKMAKALGAKKVQMADPKVVERTTGYVLGGVSPLGQKKRLPTILHNSAESLSVMHVSGGRRGLEIELPPVQLAGALSAKFADIID
ncbi:Cys-tRNA(Pro) deacylase [Psychrobacter lutiphocae]|uniref:Cys-tRNA(Pro) deacylase n=1 Tax=Psychrobacter lutiphocae TaxID=540500 RepID=UPI00035CC402|nr:Cys-tRNA(Pro) deacylase [Psychrobacter lutiphocae]